jgi:inner membrane protein
MDPITHTMAGAVMARVGGDRRTPLAMVTLILAANAPDLDIFSAGLGAYSSLAVRRGWTHGPPALLALTLAITALMLAWDRFVRRRRDPSLAPADPQWILALASIGCLSHPMLDWLNTYGIRFLTPLSDRWFYGDSVFIVDPFWWVLLASVLVVARRGAPLRRVRLMATFALAWPLFLIGLGRVGERIARDAAGDEGITGVIEVLYQPAPFNPFGADLVAVTADAYHLGSFRWYRADRAQFEGETIERGDWTDSRVVAAQADPDVRDYLVWARFPFAEIVESPNGTSVRFGDARFPPGAITAGMLTGLRVPVE